MLHCNKKTIFSVFLLVVFLFASSCARKIADYLPTRPDSQVEIVGNASPEFKQGWQDGCETGMSAGSNTFYKSFYQSNKVDGWKINNSRDYRNAWNNAFWFCYRYDYFKHKSSIWGSFFSGYR